MGLPEPAGREGGGHARPVLGLCELAALYPFPAGEPAVFLELTFGEALASRPLLEKVPAARLVCFVPDERRERWAREEIAPLESRARFLRADPGGSRWTGAFPGGVHLAVVSWGVEEVPSGRRADLFRRLGEKLRPGGILCVLAAVEPPSPHLAAHYRGALESLGAGPLPNTGAAAPLPCTESLLRFYLEAAALRPVDLAWKMGPYALFFGMRPA